MIALVIVAGSAMGQSTISNPYVGSTYTYTVSGVTGTEYGIYVTATSVTNGSSAEVNAVANTVANVTNNTGTGTYSNASITASINWLQDGEYRIWAVVKNTDGCYNYLYKDITVGDQNVEYKVVALGQSSGNPDDTHFGTTPLTGECFQKMGATYENDAAELGSSIVYFKVVRSASANDAWSFTATFSGSATRTSIAWGTTASPASVISSGSTIEVPTTNNVVYFAVTVDDATTDKDVILTASNYKEASTAVYQTVTTDDDATIEIDGLPTIGTFAF